MPSYARTARDEILAAFETLEHRTRRDTFSPAELIDEARKRGAQHEESTLRAHVVSRMCANAPPHHASRTDDLVRVARGQYQRR